MTVLQTCPGGQLRPRGQEPRWLRRAGPLGLRLLAQLDVPASQAWPSVGDLAANDGRMLLCTSGGPGCPVKEQPFMAHEHTGQADNAASEHEDGDCACVAARLVDDSDL